MQRMESALINLQISSMTCSSCHRPHSFLPVWLFRKEEKKQRIICNAARDQIYTKRSQPCQTQQHIHSLGLSVDSIQSGTFFFLSSAVSLQFWHFARILPTCLFSLLSIDVMAVLFSFSIFCKTHITLVFSAETDTLCLLSVLKILCIREEVVLSCLISNLKCTLSYVLSASSVSLSFSICPLFTP